MSARRPRQAGSRWPAAAIAAVLLLAALVAWAVTGGGAWRFPAPGAPSAPAGVVEGRAAASRDLAADEARGGHTLARHVGLSDADLVARLGREPGISAASTFADRDTAERVVAAALAANAARIDAWQRGDARQANLVVRHRGSPGVAVGRLVRRGARQAEAAYGARVVLRWDERRGDFYVLTAYPDDPR